MESHSIAHYLENQTILITGATGFLAKIFVEKILRVQPNLKKLYLLLRAPDSKFATQRLNQEVIGKDLFKVLKEKYGSNLNSIISEKVVAVAGDISWENLGVKDSTLKEEMLSEIGIVVNFAATTNFDERYDVAFGINTFGTMNILNFAKKCSKIHMLVNVSTAYVAGEKEGLIIETPFKMCETFNDMGALDILSQQSLIHRKLDHLYSEGATYHQITLAMKDLGIQSARKYGWPNTYVFTKAMGEMLLGQLRGDIPLIIIRPTIVTSTYKEPFPGWVEGIRTIDSIALGYGQGKLKYFLGDPSTIIDVIPADMVVNSILVAMATRSNANEIIYQVGSSAKNPVRYADIQDFGLRYFSDNPWIGKDGKPVKVGKVQVLSTMASFERYMFIRYILLLKGLEWANIVLCQCLKIHHMKLENKIKLAMRLAELYKPYLFFKGSFDDANVERLRMKAQENVIDADEFYFDPNTIDWEDYFLNTHFPGAVKYVLRR